MSIFFRWIEKRTPLGGKRMERTGTAGNTGAWAQGVVLNGRRQLAFDIIASLLVLCLLPVAAWADDYFQYLPSALETETTPTREDGVLVKKITIRRGDTLSSLSRRYAGRGYYYPQILLFNKISDPNRIFAGKELLVPVSLPVSRRGSAHTASGMTLSTNHRDEVRVRSESESRKNGKRPSSAEQRLYKKAVVLLDRGEYRKALDGFSLFLKKYPDSPLTPDAHLRRADCYLRLSERQDSEPAPH